MFAIVPKISWQRLLDSQPSKVFAGGITDWIWVAAGNEKAGCGPALHFPRRKEQRMPEHSFNIFKLSDIEVRTNQELTEAAAKMQPGPERDRLLKRIARRNKIQAEAERWANSPGLQPPK